MTVTDLMPVLVSPLERDLALRWAPTASQIDGAKLVLADGGYALITAMVLRNKDYGIWTTDVDVVHVDGAWLAATADDYHHASWVAVNTARDALGDDDGTVSWCVIQSDGRWAVFEHPPTRGERL